MFSSLSSVQNSAERDFTEGNEGNEVSFEFGFPVRNLCPLRHLLFLFESSSVHPLWRKANKLTEAVIGAAIEVHRQKGPGLIESIYERCLLHELELQSIPATTQKIVRIEYKGLVFEEPPRFDILVDDCLLVELKAVEVLHPVSKAQLLSYMKLLSIPIGLLINFHEPMLKSGIHRMILPGANRTLDNKAERDCSEGNEANERSF